MHQTFLHTVAVIAGALLLLAACRSIQPAPPVSAGTAPMVESTDDGDALTISIEDGVTTIDVTSARGIGTAQVRFPSEMTATSLVLRFHLHGLEQAILDNGAQQLEISISSHDPYLASQSLLTDAGAQLLGETDKRRANVELISVTNSEPTIPLQDGYIAVTLPPGFIDSAHPLLTLRWIDFYR